MVYNLRTEFRMEEFFPSILRKYFKCGPLNIMKKERINYTSIVKKGKHGIKNLYRNDIFFLS